MTIQLRKLAFYTLLSLGLLLGNAGFAQDVTEQVEHRYAENDGVRIHYAVMGSGPLIVMVHGFPDYWYTWRHQMQALASDYTVAALDTRGYNLSDKPEGVENYTLEILVEDVAAVIRAEGESDATVVGHDWGGGIAWSFAALKPEMTERLIILNLPHPRGLVRELATFGQQHENSAYARRFQQANSHENLSPEVLAASLSGGDPDLLARYSEAFGRSSFDAMMNYYRANYPRDPYNSGTFYNLPEVQAPVLQFHGLTDTALLPEALNNTWDFLASDWTLVTIPGVSHWPHHAVPDKVSNMMKAWLELH
jgi:pimeloyl-ACP methyl ester carboxylesterase